jgi:hypothetical protein
MAKAVVEHKDKLGRVLKVGDCVAYPESNRLEIGTIKKVTPKMTMVAELGSKIKWYNGNGHRKYPGDLVLLEGPEVTMYLLRMNTSN